MNIRRFRFWTATFALLLILNSSQSRAELISEKAPFSLLDSGAKTEKNQPSLPGRIQIPPTKEEAESFLNQMGIEIKKKERRWGRFRTARIIQISA